MPFSHRLPALSTASLASAGLTFCIVAAMICEFVEIDARPGSLLVSAEGEELMMVTGTFGVFCEEEFYSESDKMWDLSRTFFYVSISLGGSAVLLAWAVSTVVAPTNFNWRLLSFLSALSAVLQVPIFLIFESEPCSGHRESQQCSMGMGSYYLIVSTIIWISVTLCTQCLDPPLWAQELSAWRIPKDRQYHERLGESDEELGNFGRHSNRKTKDNNTSTINAKLKDSYEKTRQSDVSLPAVSTDSMKDEEFDLVSPRHSEDSSDSRVSHRKKDGRRINDPNRSMTFSDDLRPPARDAEESWLQERASKAAMGTDIIKSDEVSYLHAGIPFQANERIQIVSTDQRKAPDNAFKSPRSPRSPGRSSYSGGKSGSRKSSEMKRDGESSSSAILADLHASVSKDQENDQYSDRMPLTEAGKESADRYSFGIRAFTGKVNRDARRHRSRRKQRRRGYEQVLDDYDSSDDEPFMSPPIEVKIRPFANFDAADFGNQDFSDDEQDILMDDWNALHKATTAGVRMGVQEGHSSAEMIDFDAPLQGYHSDPEPAYYSSDGSHGGHSEKDQKEDTSTLSGSLESPARSYDCNKSRGRKGRRKRAPNSPNVSIKSSGGSLLDVTINEETDQDVLEEDSSGEEAILGAYKLERTFSEPMPERGDTLRSRRGSGRELETISLNPSKLYGTRDTKKSGISTTRASAFRPPTVEPKEPIAKVATRSTVLPLLRPDNSQMLAPSSTKSASAEIPIRRSSETRSLSPVRTRTLRSEVWKKDSVSLGGIHARSATVLNEDTMSQFSQSARSDLSRRARESRIRRMQLLKDQPSVNDSYMQSRQETSAHGHVQLGQDNSLDSYDAGSSYYEDRRSVYSDLLRGPNHSKMDPEGPAADTARSYSDDSGLDEDEGSSSQNPPMLTAHIATASRAVAEARNISPESSPVEEGESEMVDLPGDPDDDASFLDESLDPPPTAVGEDEDEDEADECPVNTDNATVTNADNEDSENQEFVVDANLLEEYGEFDVDDLDLQLIAVRRPIGREYGDDEVSL